MTENHREQVSAVFREVVEQQACMFCMEFGGDETLGAVVDCVRATIEFSGHERGTLTLLASRQVGLELAANVLGMDPEDERVVEGALDALGELMNVTIGQLLTTIFPEGSLFDVEPPQVTESVTDDEWLRAVESEVAVPLLLEDEPIVLSLELSPVAQ